MNGNLEGRSEQWDGVEGKREGEGGERRVGSRMKRGKLRRRRSYDYDDDQSHD